MEIDSLAQNTTVSLSMYCFLGQVLSEIYWCLLKGTQHTHRTHSRALAGSCAHLAGLTYEKSSWSYMKNNIQSAWYGSSKEVSGWLIIRVLTRQLFGNSLPDYAEICIWRSWMNKLLMGNNAEHVLQDLFSCVWKGSINERSLHLKRTLNRANSIDKVKTFNCIVQHTH